MNLVVVERKLWPWFLGALFLASLAGTVACVLAVLLFGQVSTNRELITALEQADARGVARDAQALRVAQEARRFALDQQVEIARLGGTPRPLPPVLQSTPDASPSTSSNGAESPRTRPTSTPRPRATPSPTPGPRPSPSPSASPTATPLCPVPAVPVCLPPR